MSDLGILAKYRHSFGAEICRCRIQKLPIYFKNISEILQKKAGCRRKYRITFRNQTKHAVSTPNQCRFDAETCGQISAMRLVELGLGSEHVLLD